MLYYFFEDHPIICIILGIILCFAIVFVFSHSDIILNKIMFNSNQQIIDTKYNFTWAIIKLGNGELIEGPVKSWRDYTNSDTIQIIMENNNVILTHYSNVLLCTSRPE